MHFFSLNEECLEYNDIFVKKNWLTNHKKSAMKYCEKKHHKIKEHHKINKVTKW